MPGGEWEHHVLSPLSASPSPSPCDRRCSGGGSDVAGSSSEMSESPVMALREPAVELSQLP